MEKICVWIRSPSIQLKQGFPPLAFSSWSRTSEWPHCHSPSRKLFSLFPFKCFWKELKYFLKGGMWAWEMEIKISLLLCSSAGMPPSCPRLSLSRSVRSQWLLFPTCRPFCSVSAASKNAWSVVQRFDSLRFPGGYYWSWEWKESISNCWEIYKVLFIIKTVFYLNEENWHESICSELL